ncbi:glutathione S-transferase [Epithele typhae]|uniref:glutathione S-transferase n=1 Tax=Epithele typhae TaxID=378194 RepID=UPI00200867CB|nr:glutathione S-transferase [Epithele typhae]KAH9923740.1 glutathione S-transferase [Epithele typhae]
MSFAIADHTKLTTNADGSWTRKPSSFRNTIEKGGQFEPEKGRYLLYAGYGCPWATRTLITRKLKGLEDIIDVVIVSPRMTEMGWPFAKVDPFPGTNDDPLFGASHLREIYLKAEPDYDGRYTIPALWDRKTETIVNNESSELIRIFNSAFNHLLPADKAAIDLYPEHLRKEIDELNEWVYTTVNNGVYRCGFASSQKAYEDAMIPLFESLDRLEKILTGKEYLVGDQLTEADIRLFVTINRFDVAYYTLFKCNLRSIRHDYPAIHLWLRKLYWGDKPAFRETSNYDHIKAGYSHTKNGSAAIVPMGPLPHILPL